MWRAALSIVWLTLVAGSAAAADGRPDRSCWLPDGFSGRSLLHRSNLANGVLYLAGAGGLWFGADPPDDARWRDRAGFEDDARDGLVASSENGRDAARTASHVLLGAVLALPTVETWWRREDCADAVDLFGETVEAVGLTTLLMQSTKLLSARERPFQRECASDPGYDSDCFDDDSRESFFSGHAALAAAGAGVLCRNTYRRAEPLWGYLGEIRNPLPCALGTAAALATGVLRIRADEHWLGDVLAGWAVGFAIGILDLPGPFDLLRFRYPLGSRVVEGAVVPTAGPRSVGARLVMRF